MTAEEFNAELKRAISELGATRAAMNAAWSIRFDATIPKFSPCLCPIALVVRAKQYRKEEGSGQLIGDNSTATIDGVTMGLPVPLIVGIMGIADAIADGLSDADAAEAMKAFEGLCL